MARQGARFLALPTEPLRLGVIQKTQDSIATAKGRADGVRATCGACGAADGGGVRLRACDACDAVRYCDRDCQRADWLSHRLVCEVLATDRMVMVSAILALSFHAYLIL